MNRNKKPVFYLVSVFLSIMFATGFTACIHDDFEEPDRWNMPEGEVITIAQLRNMFAGEPVTFESDISVYATVTMDDKSGNIYRSAFIQDGTAAINLRLVAPGGIYRGDSVRVYLKGTTLGSYQRMLQLDNVNVDRNIFKVAVMKEAVPKDVTISDVKSGTFQGQLVRLNNVQFNIADAGKPFADSEGLETLNRTLEDCDGNKVIVRTSGYASFADQAAPQGNGSLIAVVAQFQNEMQLYIRNMNELSMTGSRCAIPGDDYNLISLAELKQRFSEGNANVPANSRIEGVVISDMEHDNHPGQNLYLSDESGYGMALRFNAFHNFPIGTKIRVVFASPMPMSSFRGLIQIENIPTGNAYDLGPGTLPQPTPLTIAAAKNNIERYQSTLVRITGITISGGTTFNGNLTITDATGQMLMYTYNWASFADNQVPAGTVALTGILSVYDEPQLLIRSLNDISQ